MAVDWLWKWAEGDGDGGEERGLTRRDSAFGVGEDALAVAHGCGAG